MGHLRANETDNEHGHEYETPLGKLIVTPSGKTSRLTVQTGTARSTPLGINFFNTLVNTNVTEYFNFSNHTSTLSDNNTGGNN